GLVDPDLRWPADGAGRGRLARRFAQERPRKLPLAALRASGLALPASVAAERPARARRLARVALRPEYACWFGRVRAAALPPVHCGPSHRLLRPARARCADAIARRPGRASAATRRLSPYL